MLLERSDEALVPMRAHVGAAGPVPLAPLGAFALLGHCLWSRRQSRGGWRRWLRQPCRCRFHALAGGRVLRLNVGLGAARRQLEVAHDLDHGACVIEDDEVLKEHEHGIGDAQLVLLGLHVRSSAGLEEAHVVVRHVADRATGEGRELDARDACVVETLQQRLQRDQWVALELLAVAHPHRLQRRCAHKRVARQLLATRDALKEKGLISGLKLQVGRHGRV
mmetsp:Transcript_17705/g.56777  ORF Transcript_17705/g.56777 Transcript_17705/m.56777 type:complete len:221 (-) Transcript_17705:134-796(-)